MAFQRSYSKVWWGSDNQLPAVAAAGSSFTSGGYYSYFSQQHQEQQQQQFGGTGYHSLDYNNFKSYSGNLSRIQEVDDEQNISKLSWEKHDSPGSLRSQDSGFSDNDESHSTRSLGGRSSKTSSTSAKSDISAQSVDSPTSAHTIATPPTVIRRVGKSEFYSPLVSVTRRISFSGSPTNNAEVEEASIEGAELMAQLDSMQLVNSTPQKLDYDASNSSGLTPEFAATKQQKRRRRVSRKVTKPLTPTKRRTMVNNFTACAENDPNNNDDEDNAEANSSLDELENDEDLCQAKRIVPEYNNETVYLGEAPKAYNNETVILGGTNEDDTLKLDDHTLLSPLKANFCFTANTSTPKATSIKPHKMPQYGCTMPSLYVAAQDYENPLLNGHAPALQYWLEDIRMSYEHEVMSTLQTKSIAQEAFKNLTITTNTVVKIIRQLQQRALHMQSDFERMERILGGTQTATLHDALSGAEQLVENIADFAKVLERRSVFFTDSRADRKKFEDNIEQIRIITKDTRYSLEKQHYINLESLLDDIHVLKRILLISVRLVFEKLVRVIVLSIENGRCDLMLRANINMIATLTNIDYDGFASLTDAFVQCEAVRTLLIVCLENRLSSVRALALRALATICCAPAAIAQLGSCGGIDIVRDILQAHSAERVGDFKRGDMERREAVSLLTQITAVWHGPEHRVDGLKDCAETIVAGLTQLIASTTCTQTLLLCAAALNNLSRIEATSHYSIMSNEAIQRLIETVEQKEINISIFLYEQIVAMLHNMSLNKKCHSHLANDSIINFITSAYQTEFYKSYNSRAESDAQRRTIKAILHTLTRLVHTDPAGLGGELLAQQRIPAFFKMAVVGASGDLWQNPSNNDSNHSRDISLLARQLLLAKKVEQEILAGDSNKHTSIIPPGIKYNLTRQESFV